MEFRCIRFFVRYRPASRMQFICMPNFHARNPGLGGSTDRVRRREIPRIPLLHIEIDLLIHEIERSVFSLVINPSEIFADNAEKHGVETDKETNQQNDGGDTRRRNWHKAQVQEMNGEREQGVGKRGSRYEPAEGRREAQRFGRKTKNRINRETNRMPYFRFLSLVHATFRRFPL